MKIAVCVKQVPAATAELDTHSGNLIRRGTGVLNPFDAYALEAALQLKEGCGGELWAITMGPESAETVLRGGLGGTYVRTVGESGKAALTVEAEGAAPVRLEWTVEKK